MAIRVRHGTPAADLQEEDLIAARTAEIDDREVAETEESAGMHPVRSLLRGLDILRCFDVDHPEWNNADLARCSKLSKTTAYRLIRTLTGTGFLSYNPATGKYHLGTAMRRAAYLALSEEELVRIARPHMERLASLTGETVDLAVWTDEGVLFVAHVPTSSGFRPASSVGKLFSDLGNSHAKVFLAFMPEDARSRLLARPQEPLTPYTITDPQRLTFEVDRVASEGIGYSFQEHTLDVCSAAAPVRDGTGRVRASISIVAPAHSFGSAELKSYIPALKETALELSRDLGYPGQQDAAGSSPETKAPRSGRGSRNGRSTSARTAARR